jgi:predicted nucleic acid-binding protein
MILLDTCVVSEALRPRPDQRVMAWLDTVEEDALCLSVLVLGELRRGIELLETGAKQDRLRLWFEELRERFAGRILDLDAGTLVLWGDVGAKAKKAGHPLPVIDSLMAACALHHNALLATRNTMDYDGTGLALFNPWEWGARKDEKTN